MSLRITLWTNVRRLKTTLDSVIDDRNISKQQSNAKKLSTIHTIGKASFEEFGLRSYEDRKPFEFKMGKERVKSKNLFNFRPQGFLDKDIEEFYEAVSDEGPVWVQSEDKIPRASKSNFEVEILISLVSLLPQLSENV